MLGLLLQCYWDYAPTCLGLRILLPKEEEVVIVVWIIVTSASPISVSYDLSTPHAKISKSHVQSASGWSRAQQTIYYPSKFCRLDIAISEKIHTGSKKIVFKL